jgi:hypothetical protein
MAQRAASTALGAGEAGLLRKSAGVGEPIGAAARWGPPLRLGLTALGLALWLAYLTIHRDGIAIDAHAYFVGSYRPDTLADALLYSPAFSQAIEPLRWLGWDGFRFVWRLLEVLVLVWLTGPLSGLLVLVNPFALEVLAGNIHILIAGAIVAGFRFPGTWAFMLLTKVIPGVGILWFALRQEWRRLLAAIGVTATISVVSFAISPTKWFEWVGVLGSVSAGIGPGATAPEAVAIAVALSVRLPIAILILIWAARGDHRWAVPVAVLLAIPTIWITSLSVLAAVPPLLKRPRAIRLRA